MPKQLTAGFEPRAASKCTRSVKLGQYFLLIKVFSQNTVKNQFHYWKSPSEKRALSVYHETFFFYGPDSGTLLNEISSVLCQLFETNPREYFVKLFLSLPSCLKFSYKYFLIFEGAFVLCLEHKKEI